MSLVPLFISLFLFVFLSQDTLEAGSVAKVVDCILGLKSYHEWKQINSGNGFSKHAKSPLVMNSANRMQSRASAMISTDSCRRLEMTVSCERQPQFEGDNKKHEGYPLICLLLMSVLLLFKIVIRCFR